MKPTKPGIADLIGSCPVHKAVVKAIGYGKKTCKAIIADLKPVIDAHGEKKIAAVADTLVDFEYHGTDRYAALKPALHVYCRMLLGPMPSEFAGWWKNADRSERKGKPDVWPPVLPGPPKLTKEEEELQAIPLRMLSDRLHEARKKCLTYSPASKTYKRAFAEIQTLEGEYRRRNFVIPQTPAEPPTLTFQKEGA